MRLELAATTIAVLLAAAPVLGQEMPAELATPSEQPAKPDPLASPSTSRRELGGHQFLVSHLIENPFSVTSFAQNLGVGAGEALGPAIDLSTNPPTMTANSRWYAYYGLIEQLDLTVRLTEYLSLRAGFAAGVRQGAGNGSALVVGTSATGSGLLGVKGSLPLGSNVRLSLTADAAYGPHLNILLLEGIAEAARSGTFEAANLFRERESLTAGLTAAGAWAPWPWLGIVANARYVHAAEVDVTGVQEDGLVFGGSAEFDALPLVAWLPVGASVAYRYTGGPWNLTTVDELSGGFFYTGRRDMSVGLELEYRTGRLDTELRARQTLAWINLRYFW
jgi:hypothetical protein